MSQLQDMRVRSSRGAWVAFGLLVLGGIAAGTWSLTRTPPSPTGVLVNVDCGSDPCRDAIYEYAERLLGEHGFEALPAPDEVFPGQLRTAREAGAAHAVFLQARTVEDPPRAGAGGPERVQVLVEVALEAVSAEGEAMRISRQLSVEGADREHALKRAGDAVLEAQVDRIAAFLVGSRAVEEFLEGEPEPRLVEIRERLERVRGGSEALREAEVGFERRCTAARESAERTEGLAIECQLRTAAPPPLCPRESLVAAGEGIVVHSATRHPRYRLGRRSDVQRSPETFDRLLWWKPPERAYYMTHAPRMRRDAAGRGPRDSVHVEVVADPVSGEVGSAVVLERGQPRRESLVVHRVKPPVRIGLPQLSPDLRTLTFTRQEHENAAPELLWMPAEPEATPAPVTPFGAFGRFVDGPTPRSDSASDSPSASDSDSDSDSASGPAPKAGRVFLVVTIAGAQTSAAEEAGDRSRRRVRPSEEQLFDDLLAPDEEERANLKLPSLAHLAVLEMTAAGPELVTRLGGEERAVQGVIGRLDEGLVVASASAEHGCQLGVVAWDSWQTRWIPSGVCLHSGTVAEEGPRGPAVYGTAQVSEVSDPVVGDREVVRVDLLDGQLTQLTHDGVDDAEVLIRRTPAGFQLVLERRPTPDYARFAPAFACVAPAPTEPGEPFTPRPPPATPPPPGSAESPDPP